MKDQETITASVSRRNLKIYAGLWSLIIGIFVASFIRIPPLVCVLIILVAIVIYFAERHAVVFIALCAFALGALRFDIKDFHEPLQIGASGVVVSEPERRESDIRFVFESDSGERALVSTDLVSEVEYGDRVEVDAKFKVPGIIADESGRGFDYGGYLSKDDIYYTASFAKVRVVAKGEGNPVISALLGVKSSFVGKIREILPEPESSLLAGLLLAGKQALPRSIIEEFKNAGVVHIVVLSGYNVTIIAEFFLLLLGFLGTRRAAIGAAGSIILFTLMTGATATVVRASVMVLLLLLGKILARPGSSPRILLATAAFMLLVNPKSLVFDPSFQLTFLAMLALIYVVPVVESYLSVIPEKFGLRKLVGTTLGVQMVVFPYILYNMGDFSTVFLLSNFLILLIIPMTMLSGFLAALLAYIWMPLAWPLAFVAHGLLKWILFAASSLGNLSFASVHIQSFPLWLALLFYALLAWLLFGKEKTRELVSRLSGYLPKKIIVSPRR